MIEGIVSSNLNPIVKLTLIGIGHLEIEVDVEVDTCFSADLSLPVEQIRSAGSSRMRILSRWGMVAM